MPDAPVGRDTLLKQLDEAGWTLVADRIVRGICHDINGRVNTLTSLSYLMDSVSGGWAKVGSTVQEELAGLEELSSLLRTLPDDGRGPELLSLSEVARHLMSLVQVQPGLEGIQPELDLSPEAPAIQMDESLLTRCLLLLMTGAAEEARYRGVISIEARADGDGGVLSISPAREKDSPEDHSRAFPAQGRISERMEVLVGGVLKELGGSLTLKREGGARAFFELRWPERES
jgi:hypothetical protein